MKRKPNKTTMQDSKGNDFKVGDTLTFQQYNIWPHVDGGGNKVSMCKYQQPERYI